MSKHGGWFTPGVNDLPSLDVRKAPVWHGVVVLGVFLSSVIVPVILLLLGVTF
ncbi:hypothetical protein LCGC14_1539180 [marine sediment metagenome]|uniref:Uncharacterized protein n=1 Tax=marine sediment metagenome TaxID=412755 RepID=A0A0F9ITL7_9ZZZZ